MAKSSQNVKMAIWIIVGALILLFLWLTFPKKPATPATNGNTPAANVPVNANTNAPAKNTNNKTNVNAAGFQEKRTPHYVSASIANNATLTSPPTTLTLNFDSPLKHDAQSYVSVKRDQVTSATLGASVIGADGKSLFVNLNSQVKSGDYYVYYVACFADVGCKDGRFGYHLKVNP